MQYTLAIDGNSVGPYSEEQLQAMLAAGEIADTQLAWAEGMADWAPLGTLIAPAAAPPVYHVSEHEHTHGPFTLEQIQGLANTHRFTTAAVVWAEGFAEWVPLGTIVKIPPLPAPNLGPPRTATPVAVGSGVRAAVPVARPTSGMRAVPVAAGVRASGVVLQPTVLAGRGARLGAVILDMIVTVLSLAPFPLLAIYGSFGDNQEMVSTLVGGIVAGSTAIYQIIILCARGQTLGKSWVGIKIVNFENNGNPGFVRAFLLRIVVAQAILSPIGIIDICFIFRGDRRCIHDLIAGTKVIKA